MHNLEKYRDEGTVQFVSYHKYAEAPLFLTTIGFFAFPIALTQFAQIKSSGGMLAVGFAIGLGMLAVLIGLKNIPDTGVVQKPGAPRRLKRACISQVVLLAFSATILLLCSRFSVE
jgi:hypothetical protein